RRCVPERRPPEPELHVLHRVRTRVQQQVTTRDAHVHRARPHVHRDVTRAQEEELDVVVRVGQHQLARVTTLAVPRLAQHLNGGLGQGPLVGDGDTQHDRTFASGDQGRQGQGRAGTSRSERRSRPGARRAPARAAHRCSYTSCRLRPVASMRTCRWYRSCEISSAVFTSPSYSAAIHTSAASSTTFFPIACTPASSSATVPEPAGRVVAFSDSSANRDSNVFTRPRVSATRRGRGAVRPAGTPRPPRHRPRNATTVATAASAASAPLSSRDPSRPARSSACCSSSHVSTPNPTGTPVRTLTSVRPDVAAWHTYSKCGVPPRITTPSATTASAPCSTARAAATGSSNDPGTRTSVTCVTFAAARARRAPASNPSVTCVCQLAATTVTRSPVPSTLIVGAPAPLIPRPPSSRPRGRRPAPPPSRPGPAPCPAGDPSPPSSS